MSGALKKNTTAPQAQPVSAENPVTPSVNAQHGEGQHSIAFQDFAAFRLGVNSAVHRLKKRGGPEGKPDG